MINDELILKMTAFNAGSPKQIQHFLKVFSFAHVIAVKEGLDAESLRILDMASIMHDIGIRPSLEKYGSSQGKLQEQEGPAYAREMLSAFPSVTAEETDRICYLIAHHHTYQNVDGLDYRILLEADFLVNSYEDVLDTQAIIHFRDQVFRTRTGLDLLNTMFGIG